MTRYAIVIPAFNEEAYLPATLAGAREAMAAITGQQGEIIVVDNASTDRTAAAAMEHGADRVVREPVNQISRARNAGAKAALENPLCQSLVFLDADTHLPPQLLRQALEALASGETCGGGAVTVADRPLPRHLAWLLASWNCLARRLGMAAGSFVFCRRDGYLAAGGFDEAVYAGEEVWFSRALKRWGKALGLPFRVLDHPPIVTSARKMEWFSGWDFTRQVALLILFPWATRSRRFCRMWYTRPSTASRT